MIASSNNVPSPIKKKPSMKHSKNNSKSLWRNVRFLIPAGIVLIVLGAYAYLALPPTEQSDAMSNKHSAEAEATARSTQAAGHMQEIQQQQQKQAQSKAAPEDEMARLVQELVMRLQSEFAERIQNVAFQVGLKDMRDDLIRTYPQEGAALFEEILRKAFPELADTILANIAKMDQYDEWLLDNMLNLNEMNILEQQGVLWAKRREFFGSDAEQIWQEEISAEEERKASVRKTVAMLDTAYDKTLDERLFLLQSAFDESFSATFQGSVLDTKSVMSQVYFGFDSVQKDLRAMPDELRQEKINEVRKRIGFSETQIEEMAERDTQMEQRWQNGYAYMDERRALESQYSGDELEAQLDNLREKHFKDEATTIKREEQDLGFFRYTRPRLYGRN